MSDEVERLLRRTREARAALEGKVDEVEAAREEYHRMVAGLNRSGMPLREIATELGLSHQRVHQIINEIEGKPSKRRRASRAAKAGGAALLIVTLALGGWLITNPQQSIDPGRTRGATPGPRTEPDFGIVIKSRKSDKDGVAFILNALCGEAPAGIDAPVPAGNHLTTIRLTSQDCDRI